MNTDQKSKQCICDLDQLQSLVQSLARSVVPPFTIELIGDLGGGKTTFVRFLGRALGVTQTITSPTFAIHQSYEMPNNSSLEHFDFYRSAEDEVTTHELLDAVSDDRAITVVEWAQSHEKDLPDDRLIVEFLFVNGTQRNLVISATGPQAIKFLEAIR